MNPRYILLTLHTALVENVSAPSLEELNSLLLIVYFAVHDDDIIIYSRGRGVVENITVVIQLVENGGLLPPTLFLSFSAHQSQGNEKMEKHRPLFLY